MDELKVRLTKLSKQLEDMQAAQQSMARSSHRRSSRPRRLRRPLLPTFSTTTLYAITTAGRTIWRSRNSTITSSFIPTRTWPATPISTSPKFNSKPATIKKRLHDYDLVLQNFPSGNKAAAAELKKGFALLELGKEEEGTQELKRVIQRYPRTQRSNASEGALKENGSSAQDPLVGTDTPVRHRCSWFARVERTLPSAAVALVLGVDTT